MGSSIILKGTSSGVRQYRCKRDIAAIRCASPAHASDAKLELEDGMLVFEVEDHGAFAPSAPAVDPFPERGRVLAFMAAVVDEIDFRRGAGGTVVRLCKRRAGVGAVVPAR
jgi:hypothetical protein